MPQVTSLPAVARWKLVLLQGLFMVAAGVWIFAPALHGDWLWDDANLIIHNTALRDFTGLWKIWFAPPGPDYWPLTSTLFWIEWHLWGDHPFGYHLCSLALHIASGFLVWRLLHRLGIGCAWLGGLLFVIHPLAVESVAWMSETKNTLSLPLFLLSLDAYLDHDLNRGKSGYLRSLLYYLAAMLAKTSVIMLPAVLLLYAWWKRGRITWREIRETIPYFAIALVLGLMTIHFQNKQAPRIDFVPASDFLFRLFGAIPVIAFYLGKFLLPIGLLPIYPRWTNDPLSLLQLLRAPLLVIVLGVWWVRREGWGRHALFGFGFFLLNLLPVLGIIWMSYQNISPVADHFVYLPMLGLIGLAMAAGSCLWERLGPSMPRSCFFGLISGTMIILALESHRYAALFIGHEALWTYTLKHNPEAWPAHNNLGDVLLQQGHLPEAMEQYEETLKIYPDFAGARANLGTTLLAMGRIPEAIEQYQTVVALDRNSAESHYNLGTALATAGRNAEAIAQYQEALRFNPDHAKAHNNLGSALLQEGRVAEALEQFKRSVEIDPTLALTHKNLGDALLRVARPFDAMEQYEAALKINPAIAEARYNLGNILVGMGRIPEAIPEYEQALRINPNYAEAHSNLGVALARTGRVPEAIEQLTLALRINPHLEDTQRNLALLQKSQASPVVNRAH